MRQSLLRLERLEKRTCYSVDMGWELSHEASPWLDSAEDAPITWYFAEADTNIRAAQSIGQVDTESEPQWLQVGDLMEIDLFYDASLEQTLPWEANEHLLGGQHRPLVNTASGRFVSPADRIELVLPAAPGGRDYSDPLRLEFNAVSPDSQQNLNLPLNSGGHHDSHGVLRPADQGQSHTATHPEPARASVAPVRQLTVPEGEASPAVEAAARRVHSTSSVSPTSSPVTSDHHASRSPLTNYVQALPEEQLSPVWGRPGFKASSNHLQDMVRLVNKPSPLATSSDRFGWTGLLAFQAPTTASALIPSQVSTPTSAHSIAWDARPQLAPIPKLDSRSPHERAVFKPLNADRLSDDWRLASPVVYYPQRLPDAGKRAAGFSLPGLEFMPAQVASIVEDKRADESAAVEAVDPASGSRWYLAAIPALLFIPRRLRDRLWQMTSPALPKRRSSSSPHQRAHD